MSGRPPAFLLVLLALVVFVSPQAAFSSESSPESSAGEVEKLSEVDSTEVYWHVQAVARDLEQIRVFMGRPHVDPAGIMVQGVAPREVIYQAATLFKKVNRLSYETIREVADEPVVPERDITPADVLAFVQLAHKQVKEIARKREIELTESPVTKTDDPMTSTDVYEAVVQLNRQINLMLDRRFAPEDVFEEVTLAIAHAASLRGRWPGRRIPSEPEWQIGKQPADVYRMLLECLELVRPIAKDADLAILEFSVDEARASEVTPSDVYDVAVLIVSELAYLDRVLSDDPSKRRARYPGQKVPSDVFQRVEILRTQLQEVNDLLEANPAVEKEARDHD